MINAKSYEAYRWMNGISSQGDSGKVFEGVSVDSRTLKSGEAFFCLLGQRDGHQYFTEAIQKGAALIVIDQDHIDLLTQFPKENVIVVEDTLRALGDLACAWRQKFDIPVLAITGSSGKTTTKELCQTVLSCKYNTLYTLGNYNNLIGVPLTLFRLNPAHEAAIIEMGMNDFGEIARLSEIARPNFALISNVGPAHLERLGDLSGVARAKGELFEYLGEKDTALVNLDDEYIAKMPTRANKIFYGKNDQALIKGLSVVQRSESLDMSVEIAGEPCSLHLQLVGRHNLSNVLAVLAVAYVLEVPFEQTKNALSQAKPFKQRMEKLQLADDKILLDDCYNANPLSTEMGLATLEDIKANGKSLAVLGEMLELGDFAAEGHRYVGKAAALAGTDFLIAIGPHAHDLANSAIDHGMHPDRVRYVLEVEQSYALLKEFVLESKAILVKGSRGIHLEAVVEYLKNKF